MKKDMKKTTMKKAGAKKPMTTGLAAKGNGTPSRMNPSTTTPMYGDQATAKGGNSKKQLAGR